MEALNQKLFLLINTPAGNLAWLDSLMIFLAGAMPYVFMGFMVLAWLFGRGTGLRYASVLAGFAVIVSMILSYWVGVVYFHPRPFMDGLGVQLVEHKADTSFPSDHTTFVFAIAWSFFLFLRNKSWGWLLLGLATISGIARVFVAVHYPWDIVSAVVLGLIGALIIIWLDKKWLGAICRKQKLLRVFY